jgi:signal transduction histidine kinase
MGAIARNTDWSRTPVGAVESWPQSLRTSVSMLLESKFPMLLCWGPDFVQFYNDPFRPILGASKHPAFGKNARDTYPEAWHIVGPLFDQVMQGTAVGFNDMLVPLDRYGFLEECYFTYSYSPVKDESGAVGGLLVTCTETTPRVVAERQLRTLRELASRAAIAQQEGEAWRGALAALAANRSDVPYCAMYALDSSGSRALLVDSSSPIGAPSEIRADDPGPAWPVFRAASAGAVVVDDVRARLGEQSGPVWPEPISTAVVLPIARPGLSQPYGALVAAISPRLPLDDRYRDFLSLVADQIATAVGNARAHEEQRRRTAALIELDRQKTAFFSNVSHEFRTPLTLMLAPIEAALHRSPPSLGDDEIALVHRNATRLLRLVNTLLDFSRLEAGRTTVAYQPTDLAALTRELASTFQSLMSDAGLRFEIDCPPLHGPVAVDREMWEKIVLNLLSNAFKFTLAGSVRVRLRDSIDAIELVVQDTGSGIPEDDLPRVFERFHRVAGTPARTFEGSGIGLSLVRELARMHEGEVRVDSVFGEGSTFTVTIPRRDRSAAAPVEAGRPADAAAPFIDEARRWDGGVDRTEATSTFADDGKARVLVVDDNADMRDYLARLLGQSWQVDVAANGREAIEHLARARPDLILTDVMMPELDGLDLLRRVRANAATRLTPVIVLSARSGEESRIEGLAAGADDYVIKPFSANELVARVRTHLELSLLRREAAMQHERLRALIDLAPAAIAVLRGPSHVFEIANERYLRLVGRPSSIIGRPGREALPELIEQGIWDTLDQVYQTGVPFFASELPVRLDRLGNGTLDEGFFDFVLQPLRTARGESDGVLVHAVEVTAQARARREVEDARLAAEHANRAKDEFLAMLGHELRNPLAPILTALQLMTLRGDRGAERERAIIDRQVRHVVRLVDDLLDVSRIARGKIDLSRERVELGTIVARAIETASPLVEQKRHELDIDVAPQGLAIDADAARMQQVVFNLLHNAAKYSEPQGRITVRAARRGDAIELSVRDTGVGIDAAMLPHVFDLFFQERQAIDRAQGGLGLGLAIVRNLVELHGGTVSASSRGRGYGSEFTVRLPASRQQLVPRPAPEAARTPQPAGTGLRILIVDDNEDAASLLADALRLSGYDTRMAFDGQMALDLAATFAPQVAILDLGLPGMNGYELAAGLRALPRPPKLVAVTGYGTSADQARTQASGFHLHLVKPIDLDHLLDYLGGPDARLISSSH